MMGSSKYVQTWAAQFRLSKNERLSYVTHLREVQLVNLDSSDLLFSKQSHPNVESLKEAICREWEAMPIEFVKNSCASFERRLEAVIEAGGSHVEGKKAKFKS